MSAVIKAIIPPITATTMGTTTEARIHFQFRLQQPIKEKKCPVTYYTIYSI